MKEDKCRLFLKWVFEDMADISDGTEEEVRAELTDLGIDPDAAKDRLLKLMAACRAGEKQEIICKE